MPDQSHAMKDVAYHFTNLWFAGQKQNWPLARVLLRRNARASQVGCPHYSCAERPRAASWTCVPATRSAWNQIKLLTALQKTIDAKNAIDFSSACQQALDGMLFLPASWRRNRSFDCTSRIEPEARIIEFTPAE